MEQAIVTWLAEFGSAAFRWSLIAGVLINGAAIVLVAATRDRALVNRWTGRLVAANLVLLGTGGGLPLLASVGRVAASAFLSGPSAVMPAVDAQPREERLQLEARALTR
jgi:hypothetical protein